MNGDEILYLKEAFKYLMIGFIYPLAVYFIKKFNKKHDTYVRDFNKKQDTMQNDIQEQKIKFAVLQTRVESLDYDIKEIKESIDKLPERIKADIKDILRNGQK